MPIQIQAPDGSIAEFPDGTPDETITAVMAKEYGGPKAQPPPAAKPQESWGEYATGLAREGGAGLAFNYGDEIEAGARALLGGGSYDENKAAIDQEMGQFRERHPIQAMGANLVGGVAVPGMGLAKLGGRGLMAATGINAAIGAGTGALSGSGTGNTLGERAGNALAGGALGGAVGAAAPAVMRAAGHAGRTVQNLLGWQSPERTASAMLSRTLEREGLTPDRAVDQVVSMQGLSPGSPSTLADVGNQSQRLARTVETVPSAGSRQMTEFLEGRQLGSGERMVSGIRRTVGTDAQNATEEALRRARQATAEPLYQRAFAAAPVHNDRIGQMVADPIVRQGIRRGLEVQRLESLARGEPFNPTDYAITGFNDAGDPIMDQVPNMRLLDAAKRGLDDILEQYRDTVTGRMRLDQRGRAIDEVRRSLIGQLDDLNPDYRAARAAWAGPSASLDAMEAGRSFMRGDIEDMDSLFQRLSPGDRDHFLIGLSRELRDMVDKRPTALSDATQRIMRPEVRNRLDVFLGRGQSEALNDLLSTERQMSRTYRTATGGSPTGRIAAEQDDAQQATVGFLTDLLSGGARGAVTGAVSRGVNRARGLNEETANELARMLTMWSPADLRRLAGRLNEDQLRTLARQQASRAAGRRALSGGLTATTGAMEDRR